MSYITPFNPLEIASQSAFQTPWSAGFDGNALLRTIGLVILVAYAVFQVIALCLECFSDARQDGVQLFQEIIRNVMQTLPNAKEKDDLRELFLGVDPGVVEFVFSSIAYEYAFGSKKDEEIPAFLKDDSYMAIRRLRRRKEVAAEKEKNETAKKRGEAKRELEQLEQGILHLPEIFKNPTNFNRAQKDPAIQMTLGKIKEIASRELRGGSLFTIWQEAAETI